ncbi:TonB-dependent receptor plug domain-containing protein [Microbulbifer marinus]|uniref:Hemoglobin/transferrin/lactoferrin receptor protein n=1 Tax=Microbulbifer marinus TaxID=658218 RepID=A0A1H4B0I3_9GAMM|nr:TonB-dependent receptor [Microbulbifer marinus]SEA41685.1 hemoglobin/transferrin/lactoferrin receptor protein [Microbulbifer marinus]
MSRKKFPLKVLALALGVTSSVSLAQQGELEEIVVTATRTEKPVFYSPRATTLVTAEELAQNTGQSVAELLKDVPGVSIIDSGQAGMQRIRLRGEDSSRVAVLVDGQQITDHRGEGVPLTLDMDTIERIEVVRGSGSVLYGSQALGGVVNFITRKGGSKQFAADLGLSHNGATSGQTYSGSVYGQLAGTAYRLSSIDNDLGLRNTPAGELDNTAAQNSAWSLYLGRQFDKHRLEARVEDVEANADVYIDPQVIIDNGLTDFTMAIPQRDRRKAALFYSGDNLSQSLVKLQANAYRQVSDRIFQNATYSPFMETASSTDSQLETRGGLVQADWSLSDSHYLIAGLSSLRDDLVQDRLSTLAFPTMPFLDRQTPGHDEAQLQSDALYLQDQWAITDDLELVAGARHYRMRSELLETDRPDLEVAEQRDSKTIEAVSLVWEFAPRALLRASYNEGYVFPSLLNTAVGAQAGSRYVNPNPQLAPESSDNFELGLRLERDNWSLDLATFYTDADNYIDHLFCTAADNCQIPGSSSRPSKIYKNVGRAETLGTEMILSYAISDSLELYGTTTWMQREIQFNTTPDSTATDNSGIPSLRAVAGLRQSGRLAQSDYWLDLYLRGESDSAEEDEAGTITDNAGWGTVNLAAGIELGGEQRYRLVLRGLNLGDKLYSSATENLLAPGRHVQLKLSVHL